METILYIGLYLTGVFLVSVILIYLTEGRKGFKISRKYEV